jgi:predicted phosphoribosyltransferase
MFVDRLDAARKLVPRLEHLHAARPVVAAIPRGAVPMAAEIAHAIDGDLDVVLVHKIGHPDNSEFAVASVDEEGNVATYDGVGLTEAELGELARPEVARLQERRRAYAQVRPAVDVRGRIVVIVDDGVATGATMVAAIQSARHRGASKVIAVAPVASSSALELVRGRADEVVVLSAPSFFYAISPFYDHFETVTDEDVLATLRAAPVREETGHA